MLRRRLSLERAYTDFKNRHARTAANLTRKNTRRAYERVYGDDRLLDEYLGPERRVFYAEVVEVAAQLHARSVIDVGCGAGNLLHELVASVAPERIVGVDHAGSGIRRARELVPSGEFHATDLFELRLDEVFDLVLCTEVLEHVSNPEAAVERLVDLCADAGAVVITVPDGASDAWEGHLHFWTDSELADFLRPHGDVEVTPVLGGLLAVLRPHRDASS